MPVTKRFAFVLVLSTLFPVAGARAQAGVAPPAQSLVPPPPATKLEAFRPNAGTLVTLGYNELGRVSGVSVDAREMRDAKGVQVRGVVVEVNQSQYREERAFIDADELPELLRGIDALLAVNANPTSFQNFEVRYTTRGELQVTAFNSGGLMRFAVQAGRVTKAQVFMDADGVRKLRSLFSEANDLLASRAAPK